MKVILPGSYDPVTVGHLDMIKRAAERFEEVFVVAFINPEKHYRFTPEERVAMLMLACDGLDNVLVSYSSGLVIDYMREHGIERIIKGYRNTRDLEYERVQAEWNLNRGGYETELWEADPSLAHVSSSAVRDALEKGDDPSGLLPDAVMKYIRNIPEKERK